MGPSAIWERAVFEYDPSSGVLVLRVSVSGEFHPEWARMVEEAARRPSHEAAGQGRWGVLSCEGRATRVDDVEDGSEESLRQFVDLCVREANGALDRHIAEAQEVANQRVKAEEEGKTAAERMTARLRDTTSPSAG